jgi:hypothetical protein
LPSLWKREKSPYWVCCYTNSTGQRLKRSTKQRDRKKAWAVCLAIERAENHAKNGTLTEQAAKKIIGEILERTTGEPLHNYKVRDWLDMKEQVRSNKTATRYRQVIRDFVGSLGNRANLALAHINPKDVLAYPQLNRRSEQDRADSQSFGEGGKRGVQRSLAARLYSEQSLRCARKPAD